jgi:DNA-binding CsgD family transcriptional regulator
MMLLGWPRQTWWPADVHRRWLDRAAAAVGPSIPDSDRMALTVNHAIGLLQLGDPAGWAVAAEFPDRAATPREAQQIGLSCLNIGDAAIEWGRYGEARQRLTAARDLASRHQYPRLRDYALVTLIHLDWFAGAWTGLAERATSLADRDVDPLVRLDALLVAGRLDAATGAYRSAEERLRLVLAEEQRRGIVYMPLEPAAVLSHLRVLRGSVGEALALTDEPMRVVIRKGIWLWATEIAPARVQALVAAGRHEEAAQVVAAFAGGIHGRHAPAPRAGLATCRAMLAESRGEYAVAATLYARAARAWQALPRPYDALLAREAQARCLLATPDGLAMLDGEGGLALLADVLRDLSELGATGDADRVAASLREHGVAARRVWRGGRRGYGDQLSPRELEVVRLLLTGRTNNEIAQTLRRSPKTVAAQLNSAMRKLKVSSRTALAVRAVEAGISPDVPVPCGGPIAGDLHPQQD